MKHYIGWDPRETLAYEVAVLSLYRAANRAVDVVPLQLIQLKRSGLLTRPLRVLKKGTMMISQGRAERVKAKYQLYDDISNAPMSTEFAISRFLTPILAQTGWAMFTDSDVVFFADPAELEESLDPRLPLYCVQHSIVDAQRVNAFKMDGQVNMPYRRKNWSSVMIFNCDHPANRKLTLQYINGQPGRVLHALEWLDGYEIGALPSGWNWLVGQQPQPEDLKIAHFTLGGPWLPNWQRTEHDDLWLGAAADLGPDHRADHPGASPGPM